MRTAPIISFVCSMLYVIVKKKILPLWKWKKDSFS